MGVIFLIKKWEGNWLDVTVELKSSKSENPSSTFISNYYSEGAYS